MVPWIILVIKTVIKEQVVADAKCNEFCCLSTSRNVMN